MSLKKKPQQFRSTMLVQSVQSSVIQILEAFGLEKLTVNLVASRSGASVGSIYQYFKSRDSLVNSALESHADTLFGRLEDMIARTQSQDMSPKELIDRLVESALNILLNNSAQTIKVYGLTARLGLLPHMMKLRERVRRVACQKIGPYLKDDVPLKKIEVGSYLIVNAIAGLVAAKAHGYSGPGDLCQLKSEVKELVWNYVSPYVKSSDFRQSL